MSTQSRNPHSDLTAYRNFYLQHIWEPAEFYDSLSLRVIGRPAWHTLLLHHNSLYALFLEDLFEMFGAKGWKLVDAECAYAEPVYDRQPNILPAEESLIWGFAKETGRFEKELRYPGEDDVYENPKMDALKIVRKRDSDLSYRGLPFVFVALLATLVTCKATARDPFPQDGESRWTLVWSDEFNGPDGSRPDAAKWKFEVGGNGWGNHELEYYTNRPENSFIRGGNLVIQALKENSTGPDQMTRNYTSARMTTQGLFEQAYGRFEARVKIPRGQGLWSAFWLMGNDFEKIGWPASGEIDIMENIGKEPSTIHGSMHGPGYSGDRSFTSVYKLPGGVHFFDDFHVYAIEWEPRTVRLFVDQELYATFTPSRLPAGMKWVFDHPFYIILNVAVGGDWPGPPDSTTVFPEAMLVDYVRVYKVQRAS